MKKLLKTVISVAFSIALLASCQKEDSFVNAESIDGKKVTENVIKSFNQKYPDADNVIWENKEPYWIAHFDMKKTRSANLDSRTCSSWFDDQGNWCMSEHDIEYAVLPEAVKIAFERTEYALWKIDEVEILERNGVVGLYRIEVEQELDGQELEVELYYTIDGILTKVVPATEDHTDLIPEELPETIKKDLANRFGDYKLIEAEMDDDEFEVEVLFNGNDFELTYDAHLNWLSTEYEIGLEAVPAIVLDALKNEVNNLQDFEIDDIDVTETKDGSVYEFELENEKTDEEIEIRIDGSGQIIR